MIDGRRDAPRKVEAPMPECWRIVGVSGDRSCPELEHFIHCRNCPVLAEAARTFFERGAPAGYLEEWGALLEEPAVTADAGVTSVLVFRLEKEWFALPAHVLVEVTTVRPLHRMPHRTGGGLAGIVNIRGQLQVCVSLHALLGLPGGPATATRGGPVPDVAAARMLVVERTGEQGVERWVLGADEVAGVHRLARTALRTVPSTVSQAQARCSTALFDWQERTIGLLEESRVFEGLRGMVSA